METRRRSNPRYVLVLVFGGVVVCTTHTLDEFDLWISTNWFRVSVSGVSVLERRSMCVCAWCLVTWSLICSFFMTIPAVWLFIVVEHIVKSLVCVRCPLVFHTGSNIGEPIFMHSVFVFLEKPTFDYVICFHRRVKAVLLSFSCFFGVAAVYLSGTIASLSFLKVALSSDSSVYALTAPPFSVFVRSLSWRIRTDWRRRSWASPLAE